ncbi:MAG: type I restriction endonuclease subunit M [Candidatus Nitrotoga sp.]|nr:type I restriction endonuclease subunit M [Candidatus Nitrotoga sp.]
MCVTTSKTKSVRLFSLGQVVATPGALEALEQYAINAADLIQRHQSGDWGNVPPDDTEENMRSVENGWRILSSYPINDDQNIWIITEADRSVTTLLLPEEY